MTFHFTQHIHIVLAINLTEIVKMNWWNGAWEQETKQKEKKHKQIRNYCCSVWYVKVMVQLVVPVHAMEAYGGSFPLTLNLSTKWSWVLSLTPVHFTPNKEDQHPLNFSKMKIIYFRC